MGGLIARLLNFRFSSRNGAAVPESIADVGGGENITAEYFQDAGSDSQPLENDWLAVLEIKRSGGGVSVGVVDPKLSGKADPGEKRLYSRDSGGAEVASIWLKNDGSILIENESASFEIGADGAIEAENDAGSFALDIAGIFKVNDILTIDTSGNLVTTGNITAANVSASAVAAGALSIAGSPLAPDHTHPYSWTNAGGSGDTDPPNP